MNNLKYSNSNKNIKSVEQYKMILRKIKKKTHMKQMMVNELYTLLFGDR